MRPQLVDQFGRPVAWTTFFEGGDRFRNGDSSPMMYWNGADDTDSLLPTGTWQQALSSARYLLANFPMIRGALLEQASYSFPLEPRYCGKDKKWGKLAKAWLYEWRKNADVRGPAFDCTTSARIRLLARKTDGDIARILTFDKGDSYPRLQFVRAHRIQSVQYGDGVVKQGRYAGRQIRNGVILNDRGGPLAYRITSQTGPTRPTSQTDFEDIPASSVVFTYNPDYADQSRGISELMCAITSAADLKRLNDYEMRAQQVQASQALTEDNEAGEAPIGNAYPTSISNGAIKVEQLEKGLTRYYRAGTGGKLTLVRPDRPGPGCEAFENRIVSRALYGIEWDPNFALAIKEPGGAWARTILQKINRAIANNQRVEARAELAEDTWALSRAVFSLRILPPPSDGDIFSWDYTGPPRLTADSGNEENAKREKYKLGILTLEQWSAEDGAWWEETRDQKELEAQDLLLRAQRLQVQFPELTLQECLNLLEQRTPNGVPSGAGSESVISEPVNQS